MLETLAKIKTYPIRHSLIPAFKKGLRSYINSLPLDNRIKAYIADETFIDQNRGYYTHYPYLFVNEEKDTIDLKELTLAGFLYYKSVIILDDIFDKNNVNTQSFLIASICQEESIKILTSLFGLKSQFWSFWNQRKNEYSIALKQDKELTDNTSLKQFEIQADNKSAFGKVAIDALMLLGYLNESEHNQLISSHKFYYAAFQILDDIDDFKEDLEIGQYNIAVNMLNEVMNDRGIKQHDYDSQALSKMLYLFGVAERLLQQALSYLNKSLSLIPSNGFELWRTEINKFNNLVVSRQLNIKGFIKKTRISLSLSDQLIGDQVSFNFRINAALKFVFSNQNNNGSWNEYYNDAGMSDDWSTGFILSYLNQACLKDLLPQKQIQIAMDYLKSQQGPLWGYNRSWIADTDSSTFALLALNQVKPFPTTSFQKWLSHQNSSGSFSTYFDEEALASSINKEDQYDIEGWVGDHVCVSAAALYLLSVIDKNEQSEQPIIALRNFVLKHQTSAGIWESYWWTSPIYSTSFVIKSAALSDDVSLNSAVDKCLTYLFQLQNANGSFGDHFTKSSSFYTALVVESCCSSRDYYQRFKNKIDKAVYWLQKNQMADGTWDGTAALRMPSPEVKKPDKIAFWKEDTKGLNIRVPEINRLFSTVICIAALAKYYDISN